MFQFIADVVKTELAQKWNLTGKSTPGACPNMDKLPKGLEEQHNLCCF